MKILHISGANGWGGNEQQIMYIIPELEKLNVENAIFGIENSMLHNECSKKSILFFSAKDRKLNKRVNFSLLSNVIKDYNPDIVHLHTSDSLTFFMIAKIIYNFKTKAVFSKKGMGVSGSLLSSLKYNYRGVNSIICVSNKVKELFSPILSKKNKSKAVVINDCVSPEINKLTTDVDVRHKYNLSEKELIVGNIANHTGAKDLYTLIDVLAYLRHDLNMTNVYFVQIGEFSRETEKIKEYAKEKNIDSHLIFTDKISNASAINIQFDAFLLTSQREGGPTSVLEAMLLGIPVVSTEVGVVPDAINDGVNGFLAPIKDYKTLAEKLQVLLSDENLQQKFSEKSRQIIETNFTSEVISKKTKEEYENMLSKKF